MANKSVAPVSSKILPLLKFPNREVSGFKPDSTTKTKKKTQ